MGNAQASTRLLLATQSDNDQMNVSVSFLLSLTPLSLRRKIKKKSIAKCYGKNQCCGFNQENASKKIPSLKSQGKHSQAHGSGRGTNYATNANENV